MQGRLSRLEEALGYHFSDQDLEIAAITHPSAVEGMGVSSSYERLEFLGDAILGAIVSRHLFESFPEMNEGELTRLKITLIEGSMLSEVADELGLAPLIILGDSERGTQVRGMRHALEDVYEALVAALFLDGGVDAAMEFISRTLFPHVSPELAKRPPDPKSQLQQVTQRDLRCAPEYALVDRSGPAHSPIFTSTASVNGEVVGEGSGSTKKESEANAAHDALIRLGYIEEQTDSLDDAS